MAGAGQTGEPSWAWQGSGSAPCPPGMPSLPEASMLGGSPILSQVQHFQGFERDLLRGRDSADLFAFSKLLLLCKDVA